MPPAPPPRRQLLITEAGIYALEHTDDGGMKLRARCASIDCLLREVAAWAAYAPAGEVG